jgi:hypothetical protein
MLDYYPGMCLCAVCFYHNAGEDWKSYGIFSLCIDLLNSTLCYNIIIFSAAVSIRLLPYTFLKTADTADMSTCLSTQYNMQNE